MLLFLCGNIFVFVVVKKNIGGRMYFVCNYFLMSLVVIDLVIIVGSMLERFIWVLINDVWFIEGVMGVVLCKVINFFEKFFFNVFIFSLVFIVVDWFLVVMFFYWKYFINCRVFVVICLVWFVLVVYWFLIFYYGSLL